MAKGYLLYGGSRRLHEGPVEVIPLAEALPRMAEILGGRLGGGMRAG
jgi:hypothetical protein